MDIRPIRNDDDLTAAFARLDILWGAEPGTPEGDEMDVLCVLIEAYENKHYPIPEVDPVDFLRGHMENMNRTQADLARLFGSAPRASEVLNRKRALTVDMIHKLSSEWGISADFLVRPYHLAAA